MALSRKLPECWGHRGASAAYPENSLASFEAAIRDGADGIESDVHISLDDIVVMFHDPSLERTTNGIGLIRQSRWYGPGGMEHLRTNKKPEQSIPTFAETVELLMKPEYKHAKFNVDVKVWNDPVRLFTLMHKIISSHPGWETLLAPRILLGLWHPAFLQPAKDILPYCRRSCISRDIDLARKFFWDDVDVFSIHMGYLLTGAGERFRKDCQEHGKELMVWTVNDLDWMVECVTWNVNVILTDVPRVWYKLRSELQADYDKVIARHNRLCLWKSWQLYYPSRESWRRASVYDLQKAAGPFEAFPQSKTAPPPPRNLLRMGKLPIIVPCVAALVAWGLYAADILD
ncbi:PLC-like phosphodiesterase [Panus rudis PR-1116 ss-1]|nr:PLC-like phosphodiesterase [Panus rudis PR-1116 ss-1]